MCSAVKLSWAGARTPRDRRPSPHEVMEGVVGGIVPYAVPYLSDIAEGVVRLNAAIKTSAVQFENQPKDLSNVVVRSGKGLKLADIWS